MTLSGKRNFGIWLRTMPPGAVPPSRMVTATDRGQVARHGQRGRTSADADNALAIPGHRDGQAFFDIILQVSRNAFQAANRHRFGINPPTPARRFAGTIANTPENAGEDVGTPVDHVGFRVMAGCDQADVLGNGVWAGHAH